MKNAGACEGRRRKQAFTMARDHVGGRDSPSEDSLRRLLLACAVTACLLCVVITVSVYTRKKEASREEAAEALRQEAAAAEAKAKEHAWRRKRRLQILQRRAAKQRLAVPEKNEWFYVDEQGRMLAHLSSLQTVTVTYNGTTKTTVTNTTTTVTTSNELYKRKQAAATGGPREEDSSGSRDAGVAAAGARRKPRRSGQQQQQPRVTGLGRSGRDGVLLEGDAEARGPNETKDKRTEGMRVAAA
ncbi:uncharacterized protein LOC144123387 [Amblyomma americanum]